MPMVLKQRHQRHLWRCNGDARPFLILAQDLRTLSCGGYRVCDIVHWNRVPALEREQAYLFNAAAELLLQHGNAQTLSPFVHRLQLTRWNVSALRVKAQPITFSCLELTHYQYLTAYAYILGNTMAGLAYCGKDTSMTGLPTRLSTASVDHMRRLR